MRQLNLFVLIFLSILIQYSCDQKGEGESNKTANEMKQHPVGNSHHDTMKHYYGMYFKRILNSQIPPNQRSEELGYVKIDGTEYTYYKNYININYFKENAIRKYYIVNKTPSVKMVTPINPFLKNNKLLDSLGFDETSTLIVAKGDYGCIPRFEMNSAGQILNYDDTANPNNTFVPIMVAIHDSTQMNQTIEELTLKNFKMTDQNYDDLNELFSQNIYLEAGLDPIVGTNPQKLRLKAYPIGGDTLVIDEQ